MYLHAYICALCGIDRDQLPRTFNCNCNRLYSSSTSYRRHVARSKNPGAGQRLEFESNIRIRAVVGAGATYFSVDHQYFKPEFAQLPPIPKASPITNCSKRFQA